VEIEELAMFAVIRSGGKQLSGCPGDVLTVEARRRLGCHAQARGRPAARGDKPKTGRRRDCGRRVQPRCRTRPGEKVVGLQEEAAQEHPSQARDRQHYTNSRSLR